MTSLLGFLGCRRKQMDSETDELHERERNAEALADSALDQFRQIRAEYDPRSTTGRRHHLGDLQDRISQQRGTLQQIKGG